MQPTPVSDVCFHFLARPDGGGGVAKNPAACSQLRFKFRALFQLSNNSDNQ